MCLTIYTQKEDIPSNIKFINYNDKFFGSVQLSNDKLCQKIMNAVDNAQYSSPNTFIGRDKELGELNKEHLSTGCKTLLNIVNNPDMCFDVVECGQNALSLLCEIKEGHILWETPVLHYRGNAKCNICIDEKYFDDFREFLKYVMD